MGVRRERRRRRKRRVQGKKRRERRKGYQKFDDSPRVDPKVAWGERRLDGVAIKQMPDRVTPKQALRAERRCSLAEDDLVVVELLTGA